MQEVRTVLLDIDGVLVVSWRALPGAVEALEQLRAAGLGIRLLTNTTSRTRAQIAGSLRDAGFAVAPEEILTATAATAAYLKERHPGARCLLLNQGDVREDLDGVTLVDGEAEDDREPDVVVLGGGGPVFDYQALNRVFGHLQRGAALVAMQRSLSWQTDAGLQLDVGAFLLGLERAAGVGAAVVGKPAPEFFTAALTALDADAASSVMVGDDIETDVLAAQRLGITGVLVRTGKFRPAALDQASGTPDHVVDSIADVPGLVGA